VAANRGDSFGCFSEGETVNVKRGGLLRGYVPEESEGGGKGHAGTLGRFNVFIFYAQTGKGSA
jgi:hypothetical protein